MSDRWGYELHKTIWQWTDLKKMGLGPYCKSLLSQAMKLYIIASHTFSVDYSQYHRAKATCYKDFKWDNI